MQLQISPVEGTADIPYGSKDQTRHTSHKEADVGAGLENIPAIRRVRCHRQGAHVPEVSLGLRDWPPPPEGHLGGHVP